MTQIAAFLWLNLIDTLITTIFLQLGVQEANPLIVWALGFADASIWASFLAILTVKLPILLLAVSLV